MDAMQDTFVKLLRYRGRLTDRAPSSLLYTMATNVCLNKIRSEKRRPTVDSDLDRIASAEDHAGRVLAGHVLDRIFATQKPDTRTIATYHYVDGLTLQETADASGLSVSGVRKRLRRLKSDGLALEEM